jgi:ribosomal protein S18 acetylase RimI-like enzyme
LAKAKMKIRRPLPGDGEQITGIVKAITKRTPSAGFRKMVSNYLEERKDTCMVAEVDGKAVGFILGAIKEYGFGVPRTGWIEVLGVHPSRMGSGIGTRLGWKLISVFKNRGVQAVHTSVQWTSGDLLAFFRELGFTRSDFLNLELPLKGKHGRARR